MLGVLKLQHGAGCWWLMLVLLASWEPETRRITVQGQFRQKVHKTQISTNSWVQWQCLSSQATQEAKSRRIEVPGQSGQKCL
jgi:hypothetical protein